MEFGVQLGNSEPAQHRANAQSAEALGYDLIVFPDHLVNEGPDKQMDPKSKAYDHIVMAAAVIDATKKIRVGNLVLCNLFSSSRDHGAEPDDAGQSEWRPAAGGTR
jgi:alkanesulfonate monooxygenase SsuD/methylene tetrahydromethanopterin reductase-like flavin-dependent oxidoreductase (luciferase family)